MFAHNTKTLMKSILQFTHARTDLDYLIWTEGNIDDFSFSVRERRTEWERYNRRHLYGILHYIFHRVLISGDEISGIFHTLSAHWRRTPSARRCESLGTNRKRKGKWNRMSPQGKLSSPSNIISKSFASSMAKTLPFVERQPQVLLTCWPSFMSSNSHGQILF